MKRTPFATWPCSIARAVDLLGDWWTPLVLREAAFGSRRFEEFQRNLGIGRNVLAQRLNRLVDEGLLDRVPYQDRPLRHEYVLTAKGRDFFPVLAAIIAWGDTWLADDDGAPVVLRHRTCGHETQAVVACGECGDALRIEDMEPLAGPGLPEPLARAAVAAGRFGVRGAERGLGASDGRDGGVGVGRAGDGVMSELVGGVVNGAPDVPAQATAHGTADGTADGAEEAALARGADQG